MEAKRRAKKWVFERSKYLAYIMFVKSEYRRNLQHVRRKLTINTIAKLAITLALRLTLEECCTLLEQVNARCDDVREPWWVERARKLYNEYTVTRNISLVSKARGLLKRYGVPEPFTRLAYFIITGQIQLQHQKPSPFRARRRSD